MRRVLFFVAVGLSAILLIVFGARAQLYRRLRQLPPYTHDSGDERISHVTMPDGVMLRTASYLPAGTGPFPTVLIRNPYEVRAVFGLTCQTLVRYGYACVLQDTRGMNDSEGEWVPFQYERADGLATLDWLRRQPFVNGNIALLGPSYLGSAQWLMADALPPEVKTIIPQVFGTDLYGTAYERGLFRPEVVTAWATLMPTRGMRLTASDDYVAALKHRPALDADERYMTQKLPWYRDWLSNPNPGDPLWQGEQMRMLRAVPEHTKIPVLLIGGFFDPFLTAQLSAWSHLATRSSSAFIIGPFNHLGLVVPGLDTISDAGGGLDQWPQVLDWLGHHLRAEPLKLLTAGKVRLRGVGRAGWETLDEFPASHPVPRSFVLSSTPSDGCVRVLGDGPPAQARYTYDPTHPVPSRGGAALLSFAFFRGVGVVPGPSQQEAACSRPDVLTWRSGPLAEALVMDAGRLRLSVRSTADDTAFVARLIQETDNHAVLIREDAATLALPTAATALALAYTPGSSRDIEIDFWPIRWQLPAGARVRLDLTSSSAPALAVHTNFAGAWATQTQTRTAEQSIDSGTLVLDQAPIGQ